MDPCIPLRWCLITSFTLLRVEMLRFAQHDRRQEFLCEFLEEAIAFLTHEMIAASSYL